MVISLDNLGEKTLNKIAKMALSSQIERAEKLSVNVKTDPNLLAQGMLESLIIDGQGLVLKKSLRLQGMQIVLNSIAVSPFKALMGNIQLTQPSQGTASIVLTEDDIVKAFDPKSLKNQSIIVEGKRINFDITTLFCRIISCDRLIIQAKIFFKETRKTKTITLQLLPQICPKQRKVIITNITEFQELKPWSVLANLLIEETQKIFNLNHFQLDGFSLQVNQIYLETGMVKLQAIAGMTHFPNR